MPQGTVEPLGESSGVTTQTNSESGTPAAHDSARLQASFPGCPTFNTYIVDEVDKLLGAMRHHGVTQRDQAQIQEYYGFPEVLGSPYSNAPNITALTRPSVETSDGATFELPSSYVPVLVPPSSMTPTSDNIDSNDDGEAPSFTVTQRFVDGKTSRPPFSGPGNPQSPNAAASAIEADADERSRE